MSGRSYSHVAERGFPLPALALLLAGCALVSCAEGATEPGGSDGSPDEDGPSRSYALGWAPSAPRPETDLLLRTIDSMAVVSEITIVQQGVPWEALLAGASLDSLVEDRGGFADYLRSKGLDVIFLVDPLDGLDRTKEDPALVEAGRSILEPEIREMHEEWVLRIADRVGPAYMGLASEINTLAARGDPDLYAELLDMINWLAPRVRQRSSDTRVFVSFQVDEANGTLVDPVIDHFALVDDFDIDALGLSSYPVFAFGDPSEVPADYLDPFDDATDLPLLMVEGGWSSEDVPLSEGSPDGQVGYFRRYEELLDRVGAVAWVGLTFTDLDVQALGLPPDRAEDLSNFARMGIMDIDLGRKRAYAEWERIHERPYEP